MKIAEITSLNENKILHSNILNSFDINNSFDSSYTFTESQTYTIKSQYSDRQEELFFIYLSIFRILVSKYQFANESLKCKCILSKTDLSKVKYKQLFAITIDFPEIETTKSNFKTILTASTELFKKHFNLSDHLSVFNFYEITFLALNAETEQIELGCSIKTDNTIHLTFKAPHVSQHTNVVSNSVHHFLNIFQAIQLSTSQIISTIPILDRKEKINLLKWSEGIYNQSISNPICLHTLFEQTKANFPEHVAVSCNGRSFSYKEINDKSNQLARHLQQKGIGKGDYCAILVPRSEVMYIAMLAILKVGAAYIPIDVTIPKDRLHFILEDSGSKGIISHTRFIDKYDEYSCTKIILDLEASTISSLDIAPLKYYTQQPTTEDIAYIIYTSGTTGTPKGVKIPHASISNLVRVEGEIFKINPSDRVFQGFSISFDASLEEIWLAFYAGAQLFVGTEETVQSGSQMANFINKNQITIFSTVPTLLSTLTEDLPSVTTLIMGGEACSMELIKRWATTKRRMVNTYGPTEATVIATFSDCEPHKKVTIGKPIVNYCTYVLNAHQQIVPIGVAGELCIGGLSLAEGYINNSALTSAKFITPDFETNPKFPKRLYRSGDLVRYNKTGELEFLGRIDSQIKLRGFRIELAEIESQLLKSSSLKNCALTIKKDPNGLEHLIAYIVIKEGQTFDPISTKKELRTKLAPYMIPSRFEVVDKIPLLPSGKIDRKGLREPQFGKETTQKKHIPHTTVELITHLWESIFGMGSIAPTDDFFELGGHSLLASQMISTLRQDARYDKLSVKDVYTYPTIEKLSHFIERSANCNETKNRSTHQKTIFTKKITRLTYLTVTALQFLSTIFFYGLTAIILLIPLLLKELIPNITYTGIILGSLVSFIGFYFVWIALSIIAKWTIIGKFKEGSYPLWGFYYFRFWIVKKFVDMVPINLLTGTPFINWYFKLMGAKIGKNSYLGTDRLRVFDLISIGDDTSLLKESTLLGYSIENEMLHLGRVTVGNRCLVGARAMLAKNTMMLDNAMLLELSMLGENETIPQGAVWRGSPARPFHAQHNYTQSTKKHFKRAKKACFLSLQALSVLFILLFPQLLAVPFAYIFYEIMNNYSFGIAILSCIPITALFILLFCFSISAFKWILLGKQKPMDIQLESILYIKKWIVDSMIFMSLFYFRSVYATLYLPLWLRTTGAKVGKKAEISTLNHLSTDLLDIGNESFLADSTSIGVPMVYLGTIYLRETKIGNRSFIGNSAVLLPGSKIGNDCLIGVLSTAPTSDSKKINGSSWLGSPPIYLPKRQESPKFSDKRTFNPPWYLYIVRGSIEFFKITLPYAIASWLIIFFYEIIYPISKTDSALLLIITATITFTALSYSTMLFGLLAKWLLIGRYKPIARPLWSSFVWRNELINAITECLIFPLYQNMMLGTPMAPFFFRMMGCEIGHKVYMESTEITEFDLVHIQSNSALNFGCTIQTHLFEDRVMKMSVVDIGKNCTIGAMSVVLYDSEMGNHSILDGLSLLMKGESLPESTKWQGSPSGRIN